MIDERKTVKTTEICSCGLVFHTVDENDYDTLGADSPVCCPDCGNEKFQTVEDLQSTNNKLREALGKYGSHLEWCFCYVGDGEWKDNCHRTATDDDLVVVKMEECFSVTTKCTCGLNEALEG